MVRSWVRSIPLCVAHHDLASGKLHGHTYEIWAALPSSIWPDARAAQKELNAVVKFWDHDRLPQGMTLGEEIAEAVGQRLTGCLGVRVIRSAEGFMAEWMPG